MRLNDAARLHDFIHDSVTVTQAIDAPLTTTQKTTEKDAHTRDSPDIMQTRECHPFKSSPVSLCGDSCEGLSPTHMRKIASLSIVSRAQQTYRTQA